MIFLIESVVACLIFTLLIKLISHNKQELFTNDYPPVVTDKLREMGLIAEKPPAKKKDMIRKLTAMTVFALLFALLMHYVNGITSFGQAAFTVYGLWLVVNWYDFLSVVRKGYMTGYRKLDKRYGFLVNTLFRIVDKTRMCQVIEITFK